MNQVVLTWAPGWEPIEDDDHPLRLQLIRELLPSHPLAARSLLVFGRCRSCDDIVVALSHMPGEPELAVVHLTWSEPSALDPSQWPYFERLTTAEFVARFLHGGEHL